MRSSVLYIAGIFALITTLTVVKARPQQFSQPNWDQNPNNGWNQNPNNGWNQNPNNGWNQNPNNGWNQNTNNGWNQNPNNGWNQNPNNGWNQNPDNGLNQGDNNAPLTSTSSTTPRTASTVATTASPRYLACMQTCLSTNEYNPVCGNDDISYPNESRLRCAVRCGKPVSLVRIGTCNPL